MGRSPCFYFWEIGDHGVIAGLSDGRGDQLECEETLKLVEDLWINIHKAP